MNKLLFFIGVGAFALTMYSCSDNEININDGQEDNLVETEFKSLGIFTFESEEGENADEEAASRTPGSVDWLDRPSSKYMLNYVGMFSANISPSDQSNPPAIGQVGSVKYEKFSDYAEYPFKNNSLELKYNIDTEKHKQGENCTINGVLTLTDGVNSTKVNLSVIEKEKLTDKIRLNDFYYNNSVTNTPRGSSLYFLTYDPETAGSALTLPEVSSGDLADGMYEKLTDTNHGVLYDEYSDKLFLSSEFLVFATESKIYFYKVILKDETQGGGYELYKTYDISSGAPIQTSKLSLNRITSIVNTSFILIDQQIWTDTSYFKMKDGEPDIEASEAAYEATYGVDLREMTCSYATMDGINTVFNVNDRSSIDNTDKPGRLLLWAEGYDTVAPDGVKYNKRGEYSANVSYSLNDYKTRGLGIKGYSYSVVFKGLKDDTSGQKIDFYVTLGPEDNKVNIKITANINKENGIALEQNKTSNIIVMINAEKFAEAVKEIKKQASSRAGSNEYATFEVPEGSVVVQ